MKAGIRIQLMVMMFLQFFIWGSWFGQMSKYMFTQLGATGGQVGNAYAAFSIAMIVAPFFVGMVADRYFQAQKVLGVLNLVGAVILYFVIKTEDPNLFFWMILLYCLSYGPTLALGNSIAMQQMSHSEKEFPAIRVMGTIGWLVVTNLIGYYGWGDKVQIFKVSMIASVILGLLAFTLPKTLPKATERTSISSILGLDAFGLFKSRSFLVFVISSILICIPLSFYYAMANPSLTDSGMTNVENKMSLGQASEIIFMLLIPFFYVRLGIKWMLIVGLLAWIVRFLGFAYGDGGSGEWLLYLAIILHGICYDFFFVTGQIYTDSKAGEKIKSSAQGLIYLATYGIGLGIGSWLSGVVLDYYTVEGVKEWKAIWLVPTAIAAVVLLFFIAFFRNDTSKSPKVVRTEI